MRRARRRRAESTIVSLLLMIFMNCVCISATHRGQRSNLADLVRLTQEAALEEVPTLPSNHHLRAVLPTSAENSLKSYNRCAVVGSSAILLSETRHCV